MKHLKLYEEFDSFTNYWVSVGPSKEVRENIVNFLIDYLSDDSVITYYLEYMEDVGEEPQENYTDTDFIEELKREVIYSECVYEPVEDWKLTKEDMIDGGLSIQYHAIFLNSFIVRIGVEKYIEDNLDMYMDFNYEIEEYEYSVRLSITDEDYDTVTEYIYTPEDLDNFIISYLQKNIKWGDEETDS